MVAGANGLQVHRKCTLRSAGGSCLLSTCHRDDKGATGLEGLLRDGTPGGVAAPLEAVAEDKGVARVADPVEVAVELATPGTVVATIRAVVASPTWMR
jgi:hypothetical protein